MESPYGDDDQFPLVSTVPGVSASEAVYEVETAAADAFMGWRTRELELDPDHRFIADEAESGTKDDEPRRTYAAGVVVSNIDDSERTADVVVQSIKAANWLSRLLRRRGAATGKLLLYVTLSHPEYE